MRVSFVWGTDIDTAAIDVQSKLEDEINELPDDIVGPRTSKFDIASFPVVILGISSNLDPVEMTELIEDQIRYRFARIPGVAQVDLWGGYDREVRVDATQPRVTLGRDSACALPLRGTSVSRVHARVGWNRGKATVEDVSTNGTCIETACGTSTPLHHDQAELQGRGSIKCGCLGREEEAALVEYECEMGDTE